MNESTDLIKTFLKEYPMKCLEKFHIRFYKKLSYIIWWANYWWLRRTSIDIRTCVLFSSPM